MGRAGGRSGPSLRPTLPLGSVHEASRIILFYHAGNLRILTNITLQYVKFGVVLKRTWGSGIKKRKIKNFLKTKFKKEKKNAFFRHFYVNLFVPSPRLSGGCEKWIAATQTKWMARQ